MGLIDLASATSLWRGMDYYEQKKILLWSKTGQGTFDGKVQGNSILGSSGCRSSQAFHMHLPFC
jgi:hypothetical protein